MFFVGVKRVALFTSRTPYERSTGELHPELQFYHDRLRL